MSKRRTEKSSKRYVIQIRAPDSEPGRGHDRWEIPLVFKYYYRTVFEFRVQKSNVLQRPISPEMVFVDTRSMTSNRKRNKSDEIIISDLETGLIKPMEFLLSR